MRRSLHPVEVIEINITELIVMIILFAIFFGLIGIATMHYPSPSMVI